MYKQIIVLRRDLGMSTGKACGQVAHASMAFLTNLIRNNYSRWLSNDGSYYTSKLTFDKDLYEQWIDDIFTKVVLEAKNRDHLLKAKKMADEMGLLEGHDYFLIKDCCKTELEPEEIDENGVGRTLTCIGFKPMDSEIIDKIGKKYQLYK